MKITIENVDLPAGINFDISTFQRDDEEPPDVDVVVLTKERYQALLDLESAVGKFLELYHAVK